MNGSRWQRAKELFGSALERGPAERSAFLADACGEDEALRQEVESLLKAHQDSATTFIGAHPYDDEAELEDPFCGRRIGAYQLVRRLGRGGMATVYLAIRADDQYKKQVAIKLMPHGVDNQELLRRFRNERQTLAALDHPNIVRLLDGGTTEDGLPYLVMDYVEGTPLDEYCNQHKLSVDDRLQLFRKVCEAVSYAHQRLVIHRDLKPDNILVAADGTVKLLDFGIAKVLNPEAAATVVVTRIGQRAMTPEYASPEQVRGEPLTNATDVYSLGVVLYELLTGHRLYQLRSYSIGEIEHAICQQDPVKPSTAVTRPEQHTLPDGTVRTTTANEISSARLCDPKTLSGRLHGDLDAIVMTALLKKPEQRYSSVYELSEDIRRHLDGLPIKARPHTVLYRGAKLLRRHREAAVVAMSAILIVVLGLAALLHFRTPSAISPVQGSPSNSKAVAVVEIANMSGDPSLNWLGPGVVELLTTDLAQSKGLEVISTERLRGLIGQRGNETQLLPSQVQQVAKEANADMFVSGALLKVGDGLRLDLRVQDTGAGRVIFADKVEGSTPQAIFSMVDQATSNILAQVAPGQNLQPNVGASMTSNLEALRAYEEGVSYLDRVLTVPAAAALRRATHLDPQFAMAYYQLARVMAINGGPGKLRAIKQAAELAQQVPLPRQQKLLIEGGQLLFEGRLDEAGKLLQAAAREFPRDIDLRIALANVWLADWKLGEMVPPMEEAVQLDPRSANAYLLLVYGYAWQGDFSRSMNAADMYTRLLPANDPNPLDVRGDALRILGHYKEAIAVYQRLEQLSAPEFAVTPLKIALSYLYSGQYEQAESTARADYQHAAGAEHASSAAVLGDIAVGRGRLEEALARYEEAARICQSEQPDWISGPLLKAAMIDFEQQDPSAALALSRRFHSPWANGVAGTAELLLHEDAAAEKDLQLLRTGVAAQRGDYIGDRSAQLFRVLAADYAGQPQDIIAQWPELAGEQRNWFELSVGRTYLALGMMQDAESHLRANLLDQGSYGMPEQTLLCSYLSRLLTQFYLGEVCERTGRKAEALADYKEFLSHFENSSARLPQIAEARAALQRLQ